jgi:hypothetical protein
MTPDPLKGGGNILTVLAPFVVQWRFISGDQFRSPSAEISRFLDQIGVALLE